MTDFTKLTDVLAGLRESQDAEHDIREKVREVTLFLEKDDGQWEPEIISNMTGRPRYTFDKCNPVVDSIAGEMEQAEFGIKVRPSGGEASKDTAKIFDGMIRNIQSISNAEHIYNASGRKMVKSGFDAWRVVHDWGDTDTFEQDLFIKKIANVVDSVWFDPGAVEQTRSDGNWCIVLESMTTRDYDEKYPDGSNTSVGEERTAEAYTHKAESVIIGELLYKKPVTKELVLMNNNAVYVVDDKFESVVEELAQSGVTEVRRRKHKSHQVFTRLFDGGDWLADEKETVFDLIPVIPTYGNFDVFENKLIFRGAIEKLMDAQRVYNYAQSRAIEEGALAPRAKFFMTQEQAAAHMAQLQTLNTNADPVQFYTHVEGQPPPFWQGGAQINAGLQQTSADMAQNIIGSSGIFAASQGDAPNQSGFAIELQQQKGDNSTIKYFESQEIAICHTSKILINAFPKVYDTKRIVRILGEDGVSKMETINDQVMDNESQEMVSLNDIRKGKYDVVCDVGPAFKSRQQETARAFLEAAGIDPSLLTFAKDIWLSNLNAPGFDMISERARKQLLEAGAIPDDQMTDEEKERAQAIIEQAQIDQANQQPNPIQTALLEQTQANTADIVSKANERTGKLSLAQDQMLLNAQDKAETQDLNFQQFMVDALNTQADTLTKLVNALGAEGLVGPNTIKAGIQQAGIVVESQDQLAGELETSDIVDTRP